MTTMQTACLAAEPNACWDPVRNRPAQEWANERWLKFQAAPAHALLAPSSLNIVRWCAGHIQLSRMYPEDDDTQAAREGTASHWAGQELLLGRDVDIGLVAPNNVELDLAMIEGAEMYQGAVRSVVPVGGQVEQRVDCTMIHPFMWGTPDFWHYDPVARKLYVFDYKYGHRFVDAWENCQLLAYAFGILARPECFNCLTVELTIVQPRNFHRDGPVRTWRIETCDLDTYRAELRAAAYAAVNADGTYNSDAKCVVNYGCGDCSGRRACVTLQTSAMAALDLAGAPVPFDLAPPAIGSELRMVQHAIEMLKARASGLEQQAMATITGGVDVPWFRLARGEGREKWIKPIGEVVALGDLMGLDLRKRQEAITPTQARALGLPAELTTAYATRSTGEAKLVPDDGSLAKRIFSGGGV